jgi:cell division protein FtsI (penicillin-binding protein 3)
MQEMFRKLLRQAAKIELGTRRGRSGRRLGPDHGDDHGYGHGIAVTPLHLASAYAALVNGGIWRPATLAEGRSRARPQGERVMKRSDQRADAPAAAADRAEGHRPQGRGARLPGRGKTGTAEAAAGGGYDKHRNVSTFAAAFPIDAPRYVVLAMLDSPKANPAIGVYRTTAAWTARRSSARVIAAPARCSAWCPMPGATST